MSGAVFGLHAPAWVLVLACIMAAVPPAGAQAGTWTWSLAGLADVRAHGRDADATPLVPASASMKRERHFLSVTTVADLEASKGPVVLSGTGRLVARTTPSEEDRARLLVDEIHAEYAATPHHFLYAGRRHIVHGRSLGVNPLDVALDPIALDRSKDSTRRRQETRGQDMLGFESLLDGRIALTGYWTPGERAVLAGAVTLPNRQSDLTVLVIDDDRPGAGLSFSRTLGDAVLAYADVAVRRGRDRTGIRADRAPDAGPGAFVTVQDEDSRLFAQSSVGAGYTLDSGATFNAEYHFDANGFSSTEWAGIAGLIVDGNTARRDDRLRRLADGNLLRLSAHFARSTMRRHYAFLRAHHPGPYGRDFGLEMTVLHGLEDHSGSMGLRLEHEIGQNLVLGVEGRWRYGGHLDEFAQRTCRVSASVHATVYF